MHAWKRMHGQRGYSYNISGPSHAFGYAHGKRVYEPYMRRVSGKLVSEKRGSGDACLKNAVLETRVRKRGSGDACLDTRTQKTRVRDRVSGRGGAANTATRYGQFGQHAGYKDNKGTYRGPIRRTS